ncbi:MAG: NAD-binding protein [Tepidisphaeraceae bacterium]
MPANASDEQSLIDAGVKRAKVLATVLPDDALNVFITLSARDLNRGLFIIARGELPGTHKKLTQAGANQVVLPTMIGAQRMASLIRRPALDEIIHDAVERERFDEDLSRLGVRMVELPVQTGSAVIGKTIGQIEVAAGLIVGIRHSHGETIANPSPDMLLSDGDLLLVLGHADKLPAFIEQTVRPTQERYKGRLR